MESFPLYSSSKDIEYLASRFAIREKIVDGTLDAQSYEMSEGDFRLMVADDVQPTNNHNEQHMRRCVIDQKITQATRGEALLSYRERLRTEPAACRKQQRNSFNCLKQATKAKVNNQPSPSLLYA